jgi:hypothetical protein
MNKNIILLVIGVFIIGGLFYFTNSGGTGETQEDLNDILGASDVTPLETEEYVPETEQTVKTEFSNRDIHDAITYFTGKNLPYDEHSTYISSLNMQCWGVNGRTAPDVIQDFKRNYENQGYSEISSTTMSGSGYNSYTKAFSYLLTDGKGVVTADGTDIKSMYGFDTCIITSNGPLLTYYNYANFLNSY